MRGLSEIITMTDLCGKTSRRSIDSTSRNIKSPEVLDTSQSSAMD